MDVRQYRPIMKSAVISAAAMGLTLLHSGAALDASTIDLANDCGPNGPTVTITKADIKSASLDSRVSTVSPVVNVECVTSEPYIDDTVTHAPPPLKVELRGTVKSDYSNFASAISNMKSDMYGEAVEQNGNLKLVYTYDAGFTLPIGLAEADYFEVTGGDPCPGSGCVGTVKVSQDGNVLGSDAGILNWCGNSADCQGLQFMRSEWSVKTGGPLDSASDFSGSQFHLLDGFELGSITASGTLDDEIHWFQPTGAMADCPGNETKQLRQFQSLSEINDFVRSKAEKCIVAGADLSGGDRCVAHDYKIADDVGDASGAVNAGSASRTFNAEKHLWEIQYADVSVPDYKLGYQIFGHTPEEAQIDKECNITVASSAGTTFAAIPSDCSSPDDIASIAVCESLEDVRAANGGAICKSGVHQNVTMDVELSDAICTSGDGQVDSESFSQTLNCEYPQDVFTTSHSDRSDSSEVLVSGVAKPPSINVDVKSLRNGIEYETKTVAFASGLSGDWSADDYTCDNVAGQSVTFSKSTFSEFMCDADQSYPQLSHVKHYKGIKFSAQDLTQAAASDSKVIKDGSPVDPASYSCDIGTVTLQQTFVASAAAKKQGAGKLRYKAGDVEGSCSLSGSDITCTVDVDLSDPASLSSCSSGGGGGSRRLSASVYNYYTDGYFNTGRSADGTAASVEEVKVICDADPNCVAFNYGTLATGGSANAGQYTLLAADDLSVGMSAVGSHDVYVQCGVTFTSNNLCDGVTDVYGTVHCIHQNDGDCPAGGAGAGAGGAGAGASASIAADSYDCTVDTTLEIKHSADCDGLETFHLTSSDSVDITVQEQKTTDCHLTYEVTDGSDPMSYIQSFVSNAVSGVSKKLAAPDMNNLLQLIDDNTVGGGTGCSFNISDDKGLFPVLTDATTFDANGVAGSDDKVICSRPDSPAFTVTIVASEAGYKSRTVKQTFSCPDTAVIEGDKITLDFQVDNFIFSTATAENEITVSRDSMIVDGDTDAETHLTEEAWLVPATAPVCLADGTLSPDVDRIADCKFTSGPDEGKILVDASVSAYLEKFRLCGNTPSDEFSPAVVLLQTATGGGRQFCQQREMSISLKNFEGQATATVAVQSPPDVAMSLDILTLGYETCADGEQVRQKVTARANVDKGSITSLVFGGGAGGLAFTRGRVGSTDTMEFKSACSLPCDNPSGHDDLKEHHVTIHSEFDGYSSSGTVHVSTQILDRPCAEAREEELEDVWLGVKDCSLTNEDFIFNEEVALKESDTACFGLEYLGEETGFVLVRGSTTIELKSLTSGETAQSATEIGELDYAAEDPADNKKFNMTLQGLANMRAIVTANWEQQTTGRRLRSVQEVLLGADDAHKSGAELVVLASSAASLPAGQEAGSEQQVASTDAPSAAPQTREEKDDQVHALVWVIGGISLLSLIVMVGSFVMQCMRRNKEAAPAVSLSQSSSNGGFKRGRFSSTINF